MHLSASMVQLFSFVLGAMIGSFLNVVIYRLPKNKSVVWPSSHCPSCQSNIPMWFNIPILSWLMLLGKCKSCKAPISIRYPIVETLTGILFWISTIRFGGGITLITAWLLIASLITVSFIDLDIWEIPDEISLPGIVLGSILHPFAFHAPWFHGLIGAVLGGGFLLLVRWLYFALRKSEGMGLGDVKLLGMLGAFLGPFALLPIVLLAALSGSIAGGIALLFAKETANDLSKDHPSEKKEEAGEENEEEWIPPKGAIPFGPFLALGGLAYLFFGQRMFNLMGHFRF